MNEIKAKLTHITMVQATDQSLGIILHFNSPHGDFARSDVRGPWIASLIGILGCAAITFGGGIEFEIACRLRTDSGGRPTHIGHSCQDAWLDLRPSAATHQTPDGFLQALGAKTSCLDGRAHGARRSTVPLRGQASASYC